MGRPRGSKNVINKARAQALDELIKKYKLTPIASVLEKREVYQREWEANQAKVSRHRSGQKRRECEAAIKAYDELLMPYYHQKQPTAIQSEVKAAVVSVIRAPKPILSTQEWLATYGPQATKPAPVMDAKPVPVLERFSGQLQTALDVADAVGCDDAGEILEQAKKGH